MDTMRFWAGFSKAGNKAIRLTLEIVCVMFFLLGGYTLWHTWMIYSSAFDKTGIEDYHPTPGQKGMNLSELQAINPDIIGWIQIDGTHIDYPLLQGSDNMEYLNTDIYGNYALHGCIYLDSADSPDLSDEYNIIYGHHMDNGGMFGDIAKYKDKSYFDQHLTGTIWLADETYHLDIVALMKEDAYDDTFTGPKRTISDKTAFASDMKTRAVYSQNYVPAADDRYAALITCDSAFTNGRNVLVTRMTPMGAESGEEHYLVN